MQAAAIMLYTQVRLWERGGRSRDILHLSYVCVGVCTFLPNRAMTGDVSLFPFEYGPAQARHAQPRTIPAVHEAIAVGFISFAHHTSAHVPRRQARNIQGEQ